MKKLITIAMASLLLCVSGLAMADPVSQVWTCKLNDGKTAEDAQAINSKWLAWAKKAGGSDEISSSFVTAIVGDTGFLWVDTFPDLVTWAKVIQADQDNDSSELDEAFDALQTCSGNRLYSGEETK